MNISNSTQQTPLREQAKRPQVFSYISYRNFLRDYYGYLLAKNPQFSETAFICKAGYSGSSRGYLGLITKGKRNLSNKAIIGFAQACEMNERELSYFESLVYFNQATNSRDKNFYFQRVSKMMKNKQASTYRILNSQYHYCSHWYVVAIRELVAVDDFVEDPAWIAKCFNNKVTKKQVRQAIEDLLTLKLLERDGEGQLQQAENLVRFEEEQINFNNLSNFHRQMLNLGDEALDRPYSERSASSIVLACQASDLEALREDIRHFRAEMLSKYGQKTENINQILAMNVQLFALTQKIGE